ncbi:hypothetical protein [Glaciihabitans sp. UYNi722]|uniref:hypothetical protein n=1 Tax=Glaciihabitans sp. UYNi722 TaxID=3156344 RepID=UPI003399D503
MVIRREHARLARALYDTFFESKALAIVAKELGRVTNFVDVMVPWMNDLVEQNRALKDGDWWAYGIEANRAAIDTFLR